MSMQTFLPGWDSGILIATLVGVACMLLVLVIIAVLPRRDNRWRLVHDLTEMRQRLMAGNGHATEEATLPGELGRMSKALSKLLPTGSGIFEKASRRLACAGIRGRVSVYTYLGLKLGLPLLALIFLGLALLLDRLQPEITGWRDFLLFCSPLIAYLLPNLYVKNLKDKRQEALILAAPDTLDLLVICAEAGLSMDASLERVGREMEAGYPELADELQLVTAEIAFLPDRNQALANLAQRTGLEVFNSVSSTLMQCEKYGTPLAAALRSLAEEQRDARMLRAEEKAAKLPVMMTLPMVIFILPPLLLVLIGPAVLQAIDAFKGAF